MSEKSIWERYSIVEVREIENSIGKRHRGAMRRAPDENIDERCRGSRVDKMDNIRRRTEAMCKGEMNCQSGRNQADSWLYRSKRQS